MVKLLDDFDFNYKHQEDNMGLIGRTPDTKFEVFGVGVYNDQFYIRIIKNGLIKFDKDQYGEEYSEINPDIIQCRISLISPEYIYYDEPLTEEEKKWFIEIINNRWNVVQPDCREYNKLYSTNYKIPDHIPDYNLLK